MPDTWTARNCRKVSDARRGAGVSPGAATGTSQTRNAPAFEPVEYVSGLKNPTGNFFNIAGSLVKHGYRDAGIVAATRGNIMRVLEQVW